MIKRSASKINQSVVNSSQEEHFNVVEGIRTDVPVTNTTSVLKSINFEAAPDGTYVLRKPLILKESLEGSSNYIYDNKRILNIIKHDDGVELQITYNNTPEPIKLVYYDVNNVQHVLESFIYQNLPFKNILKQTNLVDSTLLTVVLTANSINGNYMNLYPFDTYRTDDPQWIQHKFPFTQYRFCKIYKDPNSLETTTWILEIINTEYNTFTSSLDDNPTSFDVNLLLDNPYAVRDLYNYGTNSATKILAYVPNKIPYNDATIEELTTFGPYLFKPSINDPFETAGFKLLLGTNKTSIPTQVILKAFITTAVSTSQEYWCIWEESTDDGVTWKVCPQFESRFYPTWLQDVKVCDMSREEFNNIVLENSLDSEPDYLITKKMVRFNPANNYSIRNSLHSQGGQPRPDVLIINNPDFTKKYRFLIYVDTGIKTKVLEAPVYTSTKDKGWNTLEGKIDIEGNISYALKNTLVSDMAPEVLNSSFDMHCGRDTGDCGNVLNISCPEKYVITSLKLYRELENYEDPSIEVSFNKDPGQYTLTQQLPYITYAADSRLDKYRQTVKNGNATGNPDDQIIVYSPNEKLNYINMFYTDTIVGNPLRISKVEISYKKHADVEPTSIYLASTTGTYSFPYAETNKYPEDLETIRKQLFLGEFKQYESQYIAFSKNYLFKSSLGTNIFKLLDQTFYGNEITNIVQWRSYLLVFTEKNITLVHSDPSTDTLRFKIISNSIGLPKVDANTVAVILNSIYFKSGYHVYKLSPNIYSSVDDILNIHIVSDHIDALLADILSTKIETKNFMYTDTEAYKLFIPIDARTTYCFVYEFSKKCWTLYEYPMLLDNVLNLSLNEQYLKTGNKLYYFEEDLHVLLNKATVFDYSHLGYEDVYSISDGEESIVLLSDSFNRLTELYKVLPYADYLDTTLANIYAELQNIVKDDSMDPEAYLNSISVPISFEIDFGQKSTMYTLDKQYLESKFIFGTLQEKDIFPVDVEIYTDGNPKVLHWDANTSGALWRTLDSHIGTLNTSFIENNSKTDSILRQLFVKYSGKGKTICHKIKGSSKYKFKFYSLDTRFRVLPKKQ